MSLTKKFSEFSARLSATLTGDTYVVGYKDLVEVRFQIDELILFLNTELADEFVNKTTNQTIGGIKTFASIPVLPASNPTTNNQAVRKKYVDDTFLPAFANVILIESSFEINSTNELTYKGAVLLIDSNLTVTFGTGLSAGFQCVLVRYGAGEATIAANGTTIYSEDSKLRINIRYGGVSVVRIGTNIILLMGNLKT